MTTTFETSPPQTVEEAKLLLRNVSRALVDDPEMAADSFALAIYPLCCVVDVAYGGESPPEDVWLDICDRFEKESDKLLAVISTWIEYQAARRLVDGDAEDQPVSSQSNGGAR